MVELKLSAFIYHTIKIIHCGTIVYHSMVKRVYTVIYYTDTAVIWSNKSTKAVLRLFDRPPSTL